MWYSDDPFENDNGKYLNLGAGESHEDLLSGAGCRFYDFDDPREGYEGKLKPVNYFVKTGENKIKGVNLYKGNEFVCSYSGENYDDLISKNREDINQKEAREYEKVNIRQGTMRDKLPSRIGDREIKFDDSRLKRHFDFIKEIEFKPENENAELYDKYNGLTNPVTGNPMECKAVYTNKISRSCPNEEVQYIELLDKKTGKKFHYIDDKGKSVDKQIAEDLSRNQETSKEETIQAQDKNINYEVRHR